MSKVSITRSKLDTLAVSISTKSGATLPLTLDGMKTAVDNMSGGGSTTLQSKSVSYTPTESSQSATVTADNGYDGLSSVAVSVDAVSSNYVGSGITRRSSSDLQVWDDAVVVPAGYYAQESETSVSLTTIATPTATKSAVSNHSVTVTPSVTQTDAGYISKGTTTGTGVIVTASELVSGSLSITSNNTYDVTNYASAVVNVSGGASSWTKIGETTYTVNTTSTSAATVGTWATGNSSIWTSSKFVYIRIRDTAGKTPGRFYGSDTFFFNYLPANSSTTTSLSAGTSGMCHGYTTSYKFATRYCYGTTGYGVYADTIYSDGRFRIRSRYNSSYSLTINGTYKVEAYVLNTPDGTAIFV